MTVDRLIGEAVNNTAVLYITHDLAMARYVGDIIAVMHEGRIVEMGQARR